LRDWSLVIGQLSVVIGYWLLPARHATAFLAVWRGNCLPTKKLKYLKNVEL
jgi:hypothetical protein